LKLRQRNPATPHYRSPVSRSARRLGGWLLAGSLLVGLSGCEEKPPLHESMVVFGSEADFDVVTDQPDQARQALGHIAERLAEYDHEWHPWIPGPLVDINRAIANGERAEAPASVIMLIDRSRPFQSMTDGLYDPAIGGLLEMWGFHTSEFPVTTPAPDDDQVRRWRESLPTLDSVHIEGRWISSDNPNVQLDFGAIAEGIAAEEAARTFSDYGINNALITLGGDVYALGKRGKRPWRVALRDPFGDVLGGVELSGREALFTSGNYNKFREAPDGTRWAHVLDPRTGMPSSGVAAVAVLHPDPVLADVAATALLIGGPARFIELSQRMKLGCTLLLTEQNELMITRAMQARVTLQRQPVMLGEPVDLGDSCAQKTP